MESKLLSRCLRVRRNAWRKGTVALAALLAIVLLGVPSAPPASASSSITSCTYAGARVIGALWADGNYNEARNDFFFQASRGDAAWQNAVADHMERNLKRLDLTYKRTAATRGGNLKWNFRIVLDGFDESLMTIDAATHPLTKCQKKAFLASVIEGEGGQDGKVIDDRNQERRDAVTTLLARRNIGSSVVNRSVFADEADWPKFQEMPFVVCGRVPGGRDNCELGQAPGTKEQ